MAATDRPLLGMAPALAAGGIAASGCEAPALAAGGFAAGGDEAPALAAGGIAAGGGEVPALAAGGLLRASATTLSTPGTWTILLVNSAM